ncbi:LytR C-terminal domain-containing protein [Candidatus Roizmanbacteria bacterium]|nr:LytR C-terminal domain-containing protein [Candidatus Roizmanbacteria bacterium]
MLYLFITRNRIKLLSVKKNLMGQYENAFFEKTLQVELLENGTVANIDLVASAIKEAVNAVPPSKDKEVTLILPHESFKFVRAEVPPDIAPSAMNSFIKDKARSQLGIDMDNAYFDSLIQDGAQQKEVLLFALIPDAVQKCKEATHLLGLQIVNIIPESLCYFKLFEKTLRKDKKELILYVNYENEEATGYLYDSFGPMEKVNWFAGKVNTTQLESILKEKADEFEGANKKLHRLIISGEASDSIRQDTFTKTVGIWTNPLKRIIPQFYQDYLKLFILPATQTLPLLSYDACLGGFLFTLENRQFSLFKRKSVSFNPTKKFSAPHIKLPLKEIALFASSFVLSFLLFILVANLNKGAGILPKNLISLNKPTPTVAPSPIPSPTPSPMPTITRSDIRIKVENGSGTAGKAGVVRDFLKSKGYEQILTANADNFDYSTTVIQIKKSKQADLAAIKDDLSPNVSTPKVEDLPESQSADVVIIVGADYK